MLMLYLYIVVTHFYSQSFSVDTEEFCRFVHLKMKVFKRLFDVLFFDIDQRCPA
jgi:hypothetical protein